MNPFTDHYPGGFRRQHPYGNLQTFPGPVNNRHRAISSLRSAKDPNRGTVERVERIEDLDFSAFCTQGTVGVGVIILMCIAWCRAGDYQPIIDAGFRAATSSFCRSRS